MSTHSSHRDQWIARIKRFLRLFERYKEIHIPATLLAFFLAFYGWHNFSLTVEGFVCLLLVIYLCCWSIIWTARYIGSLYPLPPKPKHILHGFLRLPDYDPERSYSQYRFRRIRVEKDIGGLDMPNEDDMSAFVNLSHLSLSEAHPALSEEERRELYSRWWKCNQDAFLILEKRDLSGVYHIISVSIILPLSSDGHRDLQDGITPVLKLKRGDIVKTHSRSKHLLVDTWIVHPAHRHAFTGYEYALVMKHLSMFWNPELQKEMTILIEPDVRSIHKLARLCRFHGPSKTADGGSLYYFHFPYDYADERLESILQEIQRTISKCRSWPL
jgi:hypothetical protein